MKKILFISIVLIFSFNTSFSKTFISILNYNKQYSVINNKTASIFAEFEIKEAKYSTFDGRSADVYIIVGKNVVLNIDKNEIDGTQLKDTLTLQKILNRCDSLYQYYKDNLGYEPPGGNILFNNKANIYFGAPSCGSGCGLVGAKGIEVSGFKNIFFNIKYKINVNRDVIIGYEFGRNFFDFSNKILFPYDLSKNEKNGGFAESFANVFYTYAFDKILTSNEERVFNETLLNPQWAYSRFIGYISDTVATPFNTIAKQDLIGIRDPNRGFDGWNCETPSWDSYALLEGIIKTIGRDKLFPKFFNEIKKMPDVLTKEDAMSNIALAASYAANQNLNAFFKNVIKFKLNKNVEDKINSLPLVQSKLIKYEPKLWFITPFHTIRLNLRSTNYIADNLNYKIYAGDSLISNSKNGNNEIKYQILNGKNDINLLCLLTNDENKIIDSFSTQIAKRHNVNLLEDANGWYAYYLSNISTKSYIKDNKEYALENLSDNLEDQGLLFYNLIVPKGRKLNINGEIRNISKYTPGVVSNYSGSGYSSPVMGGGDAPRIGYDIGQNDSSSFYKINSRSGITDLYMCENRDLFMLRINLNNLGRGVKSYFKNFILRDETDLDMDGLVDFEDPCPISPSTKPTFNTSKYSFCSGDSLKLAVTNVNKGDTLKWYFGTKSDLTNVANKTFTDSTKLYVTRTDSVGCIISSDTIQITKNTIPVAPGISRDSDNNLVANINGITWYKDGVKISDTTQKLKPTSSGNYTATTTQNGCTSAASANYYYLTTAASNLSNDEYFRISPNPTNGEIFLNYNIRSTKDVFINVIDMSGRTIISNRKVNNGSKLNLGSSMKGNYIIQVKDKSGRLLATEKLIKN